MRRLFNWFWDLLPDRCSMGGCSRSGTRGKEHRIELEGGIILIYNYCHARLTKHWPVSPVTARKGNER